MFPTRVLLATDGSEDAARAARMAVELSERLDSPLHVVYVEPLSDYYPVVAPTLYYPRTCYRRRARGPAKGPKRGSTRRP